MDIVNFHKPLQMFYTKLLPAMLNRLETEPEFRKHFLSNWFDYPDDIQGIIYDREWQNLTHAEKLTFAEFVYDLINEEPADEAREVAYREAIGQPIGAISFNNTL